MRAFAHDLDRSLCKRAKAILDLPSVADAHTGAIAAVQRTDSALRLNVHCHVLALDGVYVRNATNDALVFHTLPTPSRSDVEAFQFPANLASPSCRHVSPIHDAPRSTFQALRLGLS